MIRTFFCPGGGYSFCRPPDGRILIANPAACSPLGYSKEELLAIVPVGVAGHFNGVLIRLLRMTNHQIPEVTPAAFYSRVFTPLPHDLRDLTIFT